MPDDPRRLGGDITGPGGPHDRNAFVVDMTNGVLLDGTTVVVVEPYRDGEPGEPILAMTLEGRINKTADRTRVLYLFDEDGAAGIVSELWAMAQRMGPAYGERLAARLTKLISEGAV